MWCYVFYKRDLRIQKIFPSYRKINFEVRAFEKCDSNYPNQQEQGYFPDLMLIIVIIL